MLAAHYTPDGGKAHRTRRPSPPAYPFKPWNRHAFIYFVPNTLDMMPKFNYYESLLIPGGSE